MKKKFRIYAIFQFVSFLSLLLFIFSIITLYLSREAMKVKTEWSETINKALSFGELEAVGIMASILFYIALIFWPITWTVGLLIARIPTRNLYDSLFLLFVFIPFLSNLIALLAQLSLKTQEYTSAKIDKENVKIETEKVIKGFIKAK